VFLGDPARFADSKELASYDSLIIEEMTGGLHQIDERKG
jgi:hypothetical protein